MHVALLYTVSQGCHNNLPYAKYLNKEVLVVGFLQSRYQEGHVLAEGSGGRILAYSDAIVVSGPPTKWYPLGDQITLFYENVSHCIRAHPIPKCPHLHFSESTKAYFQISLYSGVLGVSERGRFLHPSIMPELYLPFPK